MLLTANFATAEFGRIVKFKYHADFRIPGKFDLYNVVAAQIANDTGRIGAYVMQVPNQPIVFRVCQSFSTCYIFKEDFYIMMDHQYQ